jgi:hypothetical protein
VIASRSRIRSRHPARRLTFAGLLLACLAMLTAPAIARAAGQAGATMVVRYDSAQVRVPAAWPVIRLAAHPHACVRFNRHAVYLGVPGAQERCPVDEIGRTEALLLSPRSAHTAGAVLAPASTAGAARGDGSVARVIRGHGRVTVTATWNRRPGLIRTALALPSLRRAARATNGHRPAEASQARARHGGAAASTLHTDATTPTTTTTPVATAPVTAAAPGQVYSGLGFDACSAPSTAALSAWSVSPFRAVGIYIGGANMACSQSNLNAAWVSGESALGWHMIPIYVGLQSPTSGCGCATISPALASSEGTAAAQDAVAQAEAIGLGTGNPVYFDMENYTRTTTATGAVLAFLEAWTTELHDAGYLSGVYSSADSGITDLVAQASAATGYIEPDDIWIADWNGQQTTVDSHVPSTEWPTDQRLHQFEGGHTDNYGGTSINIDGDYLDGATAAAGTGSGVTTTTASAPSITVAPQPNGAIDLIPEWADATGVSQYEILAGASPTSLAEVRSVPSTRHSPVVMNDAYPYFQVQAIDATGEVIGSSAATPTPARPAIFGQSVFVPGKGPGGVPVACLNAPLCRVRLTIHDGTRVIAHAGPVSIPASGGIVHFSMTPRAHRLVTDARGGRLPVTVAIHSSAGPTIKRTMSLVPFAVSGTAPQRQAGASATLTILGETDFVSRGWSGGILAACTAAAPCATTLQVTSSSGTVIATSQPQTLGVGEVGYLRFRLTAAGHQLMHASTGDQIGAKVTVTTGPAEQLGTSGAASLATAPTATATALVALANFGNH